MQKKCRKICVYQKKAVPLHPFSPSCFTERCEAKKDEKNRVLIFSDLQRKCKKNAEKFVYVKKKQ